MVGSQSRNSVLAEPSSCSPRVPELPAGWAHAGKNQACRKRKRETSYRAVLTDCVNSVINGMRKQEECLSLRKKKRAFGVAWFYFQLKGSDFVSGEWL